ncbi:uncharacterized protein [Apostichopus japonicus]|uniref:uncharacterized protein isoform X9 n=1 Tax=Stichopus japonicus TaxID=307972 RepID=UPI003AB4F6AB
MTIQFTQNYTIRNTLLSTTASHYIVTIIVHSTAFVTVHLLSLEQTVFSVRKMFVKCIAYLLLLCNVIHATILTTGQCGDDAPNTNVLHHNVGDSVSLQCNISDASQALWRIDNMTAFIGYKRSALYTNQHASLRQTYILQITNIGADDGGLYKCIEHGQPVATYCILIREFTNGNLFLIKDGRRVSSEVFELANRIFNLTCKAEFPSHEEMIWDIDNRTNLSTYAEYYVSNLLSSSITISFPSQISNSTVTCLKGSLSINTTVHVIATPIIHIVLYEMNVSSPFEVSPAVLYQLQCVAYGARPVVNLTWIFDEEMQTADGQRQIENEYIHGTFNYISDIQFAAADHRWGSITCSSNGNHNALSANRTLILHYQAAQEQRQWNSLTISILVSASSVILIFVIITSCSLRRKLTNDATFITYSGNMPNPSQDIFEMECTEKSMNNVVKGDNESTDHGVNIQSLKLPTLPDCDHSKNEDIYSSITETVDRQKIFERDQMNIILKLETGLSANRWMGTITTSTFKKTCVLISTFIDEGEINWDNYVRRLLALPDCEYLLKVEGICVENNTLFLLQEYVGMKTLDAYMKEKRTKHRASVDTFYKENRHFIVQILEALQHLHENGLSHPCIQARKILVTPERSTKLFDMCTREDTTHLVSMLLDTQNLQNCPHHAPECISEGIYTEFSDVWYVANVLWEMMSEDVSLITENINADYQIEAGWQAAQIQQDTKLMKPSNCSTEMFDLLLQCWSVTPNLRPNLTEFRRRLVRYFQTEKTVNIPTGESGITLGDRDCMDAYVPMTGNVRSPINDNI